MGKGQRHTRGSCFGRLPKKLDEVDIYIITVASDGLAMDGEAVLSSVQHFRFDFIRRSDGVAVEVDLDLGAIVVDDQPRVEEVCVAQCEIASEPDRTLGPFGAYGRLFNRAGGPQAIEALPPGRIVEAWTLPVVTGLFEGVTPWVFVGRRGYGSELSRRQVESAGGKGGCLRVNFGDRPIVCHKSVYFRFDVGGLGVDGAAEPACYVRDHLVE